MSYKYRSHRPSNILLLSLSLLLCLALVLWAGYSSLSVLLLYEQHGAATANATKSRVDIVSQADNDSSSSGGEAGGEKCLQWSTLHLPLLDMKDHLDQLRNSVPEDGDSRRNMEQRRLEFVHIPKTGGTAIEYAAAAANVTWSNCHYEADHKRWCPPNRTVYTTPPLSKAFSYNISPYHVPPRYYLWDDAVQNNVDNPLVHATALFTVVRNPYDRVLSEYYFRRNDIAQQKNATALNVWMREKLELMMMAINKSTTTTSTTTSKLASMPPPRAYFQSDGHFIPQYDFVFAHVDDNDNDDVAAPRKLIHHVLHFEYLRDAFPVLMELYNRSEIVLPTEYVKGRHHYSHHSNVVGVARLTDENRRLLEQVYARDFDAFGYRRVTSETWCQ